MTDDAVPARVGVVVNPERTDLADEFVDRLRTAAPDCEVVQRRPDHADDLAEVIAELTGREAGDGGVDGGDVVDVVAAVGGDGTQRTAAAALAGTGVALGVVPGGTVNLLGRVLGVGDLDTAVAAIVGGRRRELDVGRLETDGDDVGCFVLNASSGYDADVIAHVDDGHKRFGRLGYLAAGVRRLFADDALPVIVRLDGHVWYDGRALTVVVMNVGQRGSEDLHLAPAAAPDDGRLDLMVVRRAGVRAVARTAWSVVRRRRPDPADAVTGQAGEIEVEWTAAVPVQRDGDPIGEGRRFVHRADVGALRVCVPDRS